MRTPPLILIADDNAMNLDILQTRLAAHGYQTITAVDGEEALERARAERPDLILLDIMMPRLDGIEMCRRLKADASLPFMPVVLVTAKADTRDVVAGLEAGGDEYLTKPVDQAALVARVKSMLRIKALHDTAQSQSDRLAAQAGELAELNRSLESRVAEQVQELERVGRLRGFFAPQVAELILSAGSEKFLDSHRREVTAVYCDLDGFTTFAEAAEPEEASEVLQQFHAGMGQLVFYFEGTLEHFIGDALVVFFNDPLPCPDPAARAVKMALAMRERTKELAKTWRKRGYHLQFRAGIAQGYATLGRIGFEGRFDYGAIGTVMNLSARLCDEARGDQILVSQRVHAAVDTLVDCDPVGQLTLRGFLKPVPAFSVLGFRQEAGAAKTTDGFKQCLRCGTCYDATVAECGKDGSTLALMRVPRLLRGRYRIERHLGRGGMGAVYQAVDTELERRVAVKLVREELVDSPEAAERFRLEGLAAASFTHPNVVTVHDFGVAHTFPFLVMEFLEGSTLRDELKRQRRLAQAELLGIVRSICDGLDAAHRRGLVHRDLKPENIFLATHGAKRIPKILDFGVSTFLVPSTTAKTAPAAASLAGTPQYMAPEQLHGQGVSPLWDLWALAVVVYEMLTGALPFGGATVAESFASVLACQFTPLSVHLPEAPEAWEAFFARAFASDPAARIDSAPEFHARLERVLAGAPGAGARASLEGPAAPPE